MIPLPPAHRILVIDDTPAIHGDFRKILQGQTSAPALTDLATSIFGVSAPAAQRELFTVDSAYQGEDGYHAVLTAVREGRPFALAFVDMRMPPGWDGLETVRQLVKADPRLQVVICTAYSDQEWSTIRREFGTSDNLLILKKPFDAIEVLQLAHTLSKKWTLHQTHHAQIADLDLLAKRKTQELYRAEELFAQAFNASPLAQCIQSLDDGCIVEVNAAFERVLGLSRALVLDKTPLPLGRGIDPDRWATLLTKIAEGQTLDDVPVIYLSENAAPREMRCSGRAIALGNLRCAIWVIRDVTEQVNLEQQLRQSQKMEAIGQLVSGVAHDFNNLLTIILNYAGFALEQEGLTPATLDSLGNVRGAAERAAALTRQLLVFSRQQLPNPLPLDLSNVILGFQEMLTRLIPTRITLEWNCPSGLPIVRADEANVEQVIMNLVVNARDAIHREGRISISLAPHTQPVTANPERAPGPYVKLSVADTGTGIQPEVISRIFDPFFTTKEVGKGTGMGLSTVDSIARQHHGWIDVNSRLGVGSRFDLFFPADPTLQSLVTKEALPTSEDFLAGLHILYVEDDPIVRKVTQAMLASRCRRLEVAHDGPSAVTAWRSSSGEVDLLITDIVMPGGISGADLTRQFSAENPALKVLITSGYSSQLLVQNESLSAGLRILSKPYDREMLIEAIQQTIAAPSVCPPLLPTV